ncbi:MAG: decarboxylating 6-phosphogluconate dehydrogenase [Deltaproteobacteria bacterium]|nr:decarboxylating 6-phosphogluconate dehydrogenase [Deltaproteobacteria bacterium]
MRIAMVGLGRMGMNMTKRLLLGGHEVIAYTRDKKKIEEAERSGATGVANLKELVDALKPPRIIWMMVPAGEATEEMIRGLRKHLSKGDILIDGGNTFYKDDIRRYGDLLEDGINYMDVGTSGGIWGLEVGYCLMIGGEKKDFDTLEPVFKTLAPKDGYLYCGLPGAGHFVKMVHNGIEYGLMQAYGEGFEIINESRYKDGVDLSKVAGLWNRGSVVRSWLLELLESALTKDPGLKNIKGYVDDSGEGRWTVNEAVELGVSAPVITESLFRRFRSRQEDSFGEKVLAALRQEFGGHAVKKS